MWSLLLGLALATEVTVPVDIGVGPAFLGISGPVRQQRTWHTGLSLTLEAIVDRKTIRKFKNRIPKKYRDFALRLDEVRIRPAWFLVPETVFLSPKGPADTGVYGASWHLLGISVPLSTKPFRLAPEVAIPLTWIHIQSDSLPSPTNVVRLGIQGRVDLEIPITKGLLVSGGWSSDVFAPQPLGGGVFTFRPADEAVWHIGQAYAQLHVRIPVHADI